MVSLFGLALLAVPRQTTILIGDARRDSGRRSEVYLEAPNYGKALMKQAAMRLSFGEQAKMEAVLKRLKQEAAKWARCVAKTGDKQGESVYVGLALVAIRNVGFGVSVGKAFGLTDKTGEGIAIYVKPDNGDAAPENGSSEIKEPLKEL